MRSDHNVRIAALARRVRKEGARGSAVTMTGGICLCCSDFFSVFTPPQVRGPGVSGAAADLLSPRLEWLLIGSWHTVYKHRDKERERQPGS